MLGLRELWSSMRNETHVAASEGYLLRLVESKDEVRAFVAVTQENLQPALVVEMPRAVLPSGVALITTKAFKATYAAFTGLPKGHIAVALELRDADFEDLFAQLCEEVVSTVQVAVTTSEASHAIFRCIERWRRFIESGKRALSDEEVQGLIGELVVLARCVELVGAEVAVDAWRGPLRALRDFELPSYSVEVKTYQSDSGSRIRVSDPGQLASDPERRLFLIVVRVSKVGSGGKTLPEWTESVKDGLHHLLRTCEMYEDRLAECGYLPAHAEQYSQRYVSGPVRAFRVEDGFPRIGPKDIPQGVHEVRFSIELSALSSFETDPDTVVGHLSAAETPS